MRGEAIAQGAAGADAELDGPADAGASADLLALLAAADDWLFVLGADGRVLHASESAMRGLGSAFSPGVAFGSLWRSEQQTPLEAALGRLRGCASPVERAWVETRNEPRARIELRLSSGSFRGAASVFAIGRRLGLLPNDDAFLRATSALANVEQKYRALFDSSMFGMAISDEVGRIHESNAAFERMTGFSAAEMQGKNPEELGLVVPEEQAHTVQQLAAAGASQLVTHEFRSRDGTAGVALRATTRLQLGDVPLAFTVACDVTDFVQTQREQRDRDQKFRALFDNVGDGMFFADAQGRFYEVNNAACEQLGYTREELLQLTVMQISGKTNFDYGRLLQSFDARAPIAYETTHRRKDGSLIPIELTIARIEHGGEVALAGIARDLTQRRKIQNELRDARDRLQATLQALPDLVFEWDADGVVHDFYSSRPDLLTYPPEVFLGNNVASFLPPDVARVVLGTIREAVETGLSIGNQYQLPDRWMELSAARRGGVPPDQPARVIAIAREITERKLREQELERKNDELMRFTYTVSHDLKSPLVTIKSFLGYLAEDMASGDAEKVARDLGFIQKAADRMDALLDDLLELSRVGRKVNPPERLSLRELCQVACELVAGRIQTCGAEVVLPETDVWLWGDRVRLIEVMQNLIDNAVKFSAGSPPVRVVISAARSGEDWVVSVRDRGIGIDPRHQHKLFGLFEKLHVSEEGTGIGLALVKRIIDVHGGRVWIESEGEGFGTTVSFCLPNSRAEGDS